MLSRAFAGLTAGLVAGALGASAAAAYPSTIYGSLPYLAPNNSPFADEPFNHFVLETFDFGPQSGYTRSGGVILGPGALTDSVGGFGSSLYSAGVTSITFDFAPYLASRGRLPNRAGIVWTDVGYQFGECCGVFSGVGPVQFEAFDPDGFSMGVVSVNLGDGFATGGTFEDRFFGVSTCYSCGISRITLTMPTSDDWEMDHLQFGTAVPEPGSWAMLIAGFGLVGAAARRRRHRKPVAA
jgi:hypothetical protein